MRRAWVLGAAMAIVLVGCGGSAAKHQASQALTAVTPTPQATTLPPAAGGASSVPLGGLQAVGPNGSVDYPELPTGPLTSVTRRVAGPVTLRLFTTASNAVVGCDPYTSQCIPDWCQSTSQVALELSTDTIAAREITENIGVGPGSHLSVLNSVTEGSFEGDPVQVVIAKAADDVDHVELAIGSSKDVASPVHGLLALAVGGSPATGTLTAYDSKGKALQQLPIPSGRTQYLSDCQPQPIKLPKPGVQPADRAAAVEQVRAAFANTFTHAPPSGDIYHGLTTVQDGDQLHNAVDQVRKNFPTPFDTITVTTGDIVFTDPT
ncbi:MAG TPA: hypothetical protein VHX15_14645, partial [Frankiaceae bacterium]|nr:hypothetical protein [Frankiaceae bacterium]